MRVHDPNRSCPCVAPGCYRVFKREKNLLQHFTSCHPELPVPESLLIKPVQPKWKIFVAQDAQAKKVRGEEYTVRIEKEDGEDDEDEDEDDDDGEYRDDNEELKEGYVLGEEEVEVDGSEDGELSPRAEDGEDGSGDYVAKSNQRSRTGSVIGRDHSSETEGKGAARERRHRVISMKEKERLEFERLMEETEDRKKKEKDHKRKRDQLSSSSSSSSSSSPTQPQKFQKHNGDFNSNHISQNASHPMLSTSLLLPSPSSTSCLPYNFTPLPQAPAATASPVISQPLPKKSTSSASNTPLSSSTPSPIQASFSVMPPYPHAQYLFTPESMGNLPPNMNTNMNMMPMTPYHFAFPPYGYPHALPQNYPPLFYLQTLALQSLQEAPSESSSKKTIISVSSSSSSPSPTILENQTLSVESKAKLSISALIN